MALLTNLAPVVPLTTLETGYGLRRGSRSSAVRGTFGKGPWHCVNNEKPIFGKGTQLIVSLSEYLHSDVVLAEPPPYLTPDHQGAEILGQMMNTFI